MALKVLSVKVDPDVWEQWRDTQEKSEAATGNQFVELLLESFLNPKTKTVEVATPTEAQTEALQLKENEIGRLKIQIDQLNEKLHERPEIDPDAIENMKAEIQQKAARISELENQPPKGLEIGENQVLITIPPVVEKVIDKEIQIGNKHGGNFSRADLLLNTFWESVTKGASYPFKVWTKNDLIKIKKQLETPVE